MIVVSPLSVGILLLLAIHCGAKFFLETLNNCHALSLKNSVPIAYKDNIDLETYQKSIQYTIAKSHFGSIASLAKFVGMGVVVLFGVIPHLYLYLTTFLGNSIWGLSIVFFFIQYIFSLFNLPFSWWYQFRLEEHFGFNRSSQKIFWIDQLKGLIIGFLFEVPLLAAFLKLYNSAPKSWWLWDALLLIGFQAFMIIIYPLFILPRFNKLTPLPEGSLKNRLLKLAQKAQFPIQNIFTIDGSRRSAHSNAFFTGLGKFRHIVLYDTLIQQLDEEELTAVLAHEIGHYKKQHIKHQLVLESFMTVLGLFIVFLLDQCPAILPSLGFSQQQAIIPLLLFFSIVMPAIMFWIEPFFCKLSRIHEYEADKFSHDLLGSSVPLLSSLRKLHTNNLSNLVPHPFYSAFYYSHPTLIEREQKLQSYDR